MTLTATSKKKQLSLIHLLLFLPYVLPSLHMRKREMSNSNGYILVSQTKVTVHFRGN